MEETGSQWGCYNFITAFESANLSRTFKVTYTTVNGIPTESYNGGSISWDNVCWSGVLNLMFLRKVSPWVKFDNFHLVIIVYNVIISMSWIIRMTSLKQNSVEQLHGNIYFYICLYNCKIALGYSNSHGLMIKG